MTKVAAHKIVLEAAKEMLQRWEDQVESGPEGIEVYIDPKIDRLERALSVVLG